MTELFDLVERFANMLDEHNGAGDGELSMRVMKVTEEAGEVAQAWIGAHGANPRKGYSHTLDDVAGELADVVLAALVAMESLGYRPEKTLATRVAELHERLDAAAVA